MSNGSTSRPFFQPPQGARGQDRPVLNEPRAILNGILWIYQWDSRTFDRRQNLRQRCPWCQTGISLGHRNARPESKEAGQYARWPSLAAVPSPLESRAVVRLAVKLSLLYCTMWISWRKFSINGATEGVLWSCSGWLERVWKYNILKLFNFYFLLFLYADRSSVTWPYSWGWKSTVR